MSTTAWYYVDPSTGQPAGPVDLVALQGLISRSNVDSNTMMWAEGRPEWQKLSDVDELVPLVKVALEVAAAAAKNRGAAAGDEDDTLAAFRAEINTMDAEGGEGGAEGEESADKAGEGPSTPEELEFEDDDGTVYVWDTKLRKYMPKVPEGEEGAKAGDDAFDYSMMTYTGDDEVIPTLAAARAAEAAAEAEEVNGGRGKDAKKRKAAGQEEGQASGAEGAGGDNTEAGGEHAKVQLQLRGKKAKPAKPQQPQGWFDLKNNTSVYVTGLPLDVTVEEVHAAFSKYGLIKEDDAKQPRIKLYRDKSSGALKGDALVTYLKEPSVHLAVQLLDGVPLRDGGATNMTVSLAKFEMKGDAFVPKQKAGNKNRKAVLEKQEKLLGWGGFDDKLPPEKVTLILKHLFAPSDVPDDSAGKELEDEVAGECNKLGPVEKVRVFRTNPDGVVSVKFKTEDGAKACMAKMNGRFFAGRQLVAHMWDGFTNYNVKAKESAEEEEARLEAFAKELEAKRAQQQEQEQQQQ